MIIVSISTTSTSLTKSKLESAVEEVRVVFSSFGLSLGYLSVERIMTEGEGARSDKKRRRSRSRSSKDDTNDANVNEHNVEVVTESTIQKESTSDETNKAQHDEGEVNKDRNEEHDAKPRRKRKRKRKSKQQDPSASQEQDDSTTAKLSSLDLTVFVEGIPFDCSEEDVKAFFASNGCEDILQLRLPRWQDSGRLRGYGHVVFDSEASRNKAVNELSGKHLGTRYLTVQAPKAPRPDTSMGAVETRNARDQPEGCRVVFVKNLPYDATEDDVKEAFQICGKILDGGVRIARNYNSRQSKGFAYVEYKNPEGAHGAVQKASKPFGMTVKGRPCFVDYEEGRMKGSFKTAEGRLWTREYGAHNKQTGHNK